MAEQLTSEQIRNRILYDMGIERPLGKSTGYKADLFAEAMSAAGPKQEFHPELFAEPTPVLDFSDARYNPFDPGLRAPAQQEMIRVMLAMATTAEDPYLDGLNSIVVEEQRQMMLGRAAFRETLGL